MPRWPRQDQHGVIKIARHLPRFYARIQVQFLFFHESAFCSFTLCILPPIFFLAVTRFYFYFYSSFSSFLQWGETFGLPRFIIFNHILHSPLELRTSFSRPHEALFIFNNILPSPSFYRRCFIFETHTHAGLNHAANFCLQE